MHLKKCNKNGLLEYQNAMIEDLEQNYIEFNFRSDKNTLDNKNCEISLY